MKYDNITILTIIVVVCSIIILGIWYYIGNDYRTNMPLYQVESMCEDTSNFADVCYQTGLNDGDFMYLYNMVSDLSDTNERLTSLIDLCGNLYIIGATDRQNGEHHNIKSYIKQKCISFYTK